MTLDKIEKNDKICALVRSDSPVIVDVRSALDLLISAEYSVGTGNIVINKELIVNDFFVLSTGLAGEILQKYVNYGGRIAVYGDYSRYTSRPLKDFICESNRGRNAFFVSTEQEAVDMLLR